MTLRPRGRGSGAHQNCNTRVRSEVHEAGHTPLADRQPETIDMDDNDYFDELDSPNVIQSDTNYTRDIDLGSASAPSRFPSPDLPEERDIAVERQDDEERRDHLHDSENESSTFDESIHFESRSPPTQDAKIKIEEAMQVFGEIGQIGKLQPELVERDEIRNS